MLKEEDLQRYLSKKIPYTEAKLGLKIDPKFVFKNNIYLLKKRIDIVHLHDPTALTLCVIADRISGKIPKMIFAKENILYNKKSKIYIIQIQLQKNRKIYLCF